MIVPSLHLTFVRLRSGDLLPLDILDSGSQKFDISEDLLCLTVLGTQTLFENGE